MSAEEASGLSKSARKRANKKARDAEAAQEAAAPEPVPEKPASKSKAKAKAEPAAPPAAPKSQPKAKAKGKAEPPPAAQPKVEQKPEPKAASKAASKAGAKAKAKAKPKEEEPEPEKKSAEPLTYFEMDDGSRAGDWEQASGMSKKQQRQREKYEEKKAQEKAVKAGVVMEARGNQHIPGMAPVEVQIAQQKGGKAQPKASQSVVAVAAVSAAAVANKDVAPEKAAAPDKNISVSIKVPDNCIGRVVGPKGATVNMIKEKTGIKTLDLAGDMCTIVGEPDPVALAENAVRQLIEKGYMSLAYEDFEEDFVSVYPTLIPEIVGQKGVTIIEIKKQAKVEIQIPPVPKNPPAGKKYKLTLAGTKASVALGKEIINSIAMYGHHELTHPGLAHKELPDIASWQYAYIIGPKGSGLRHIQNNFKVKVNIPREYSANDQVVVIGEPRDIERAIKSIEKILWDAEQPKGRGAPDKASDDWGDEGEVEDWMRPYMYQRK